MFIFSTNILCLPLFIVILVTNGYLLLLAARFIVANTVKTSPFDQALRQLTDPLPETVERWLTRITRKAPQRWATWLLVVGALLLIQNLLVALVVATR